MADATTLRGRASPSRSPRKRKSASSPRMEAEWQPGGGPHSWADYVERRRSAVSAIHDELDERVALMEDRARQAVTHAAAVIQRSRDQEAECLEYINALEDKVQALQQARRTAAAELTAFEEAATKTREERNKELQDVTQAVEAARAELAAVQAACERHRAEDAEALRRRGEETEGHLQAQTATVESRFQKAVAVLQSQVRERKAWADAQCAMCEERVRDATRRAEVTATCAILRCSGAEEEDVEKESSASAATASKAQVASIELEMRKLEREMEELAASAGARMEAVVKEQNAAKAELTELQSAVRRKRSELQELTQQSNELSLFVQSGAAAPSRRLDDVFMEAAEVHSAATATSGAEAETEKGGTASLNKAPAEKQKDVTLLLELPSHDLSELAGLLLLPPSLPAASRDRSDAGPREGEVESRPRTSGGTAAPAHTTASSLSPIRESSALSSTSSPVVRLASSSTVYHEPSLVRDVSCSFDAFTAVSPLKRRSV